MTASPLLNRARDLWVALASAEFPTPGSPTGANVVVASDTRLCPPSWVGLVVLGDAGLVATPDPRAAETVTRALAGLPPPALVDPDRLRRALPVGTVLGPASLLYLDRENFLRRPGDDSMVEQVPKSDGELAALLARAGDEDAGESGLAEISSPAFVLRESGEVVAAAGYQEWPRSVAHLGVLVDRGQRGRGLARTVASAAVTHALDAGLLAQWRAQPHPSRRVARTLGFKELGAQLSVRLDGYDVPPNRRR